MVSKWFIPSFVTASMLIAGGLASASGHAKDKPPVFALQVLKDESTQLAAFTYLMPKGWIPDNNFQWQQKGAFLASVSASSPDKTCGVTQLERMIYSYNIQYTLQGTVLQTKGAVVHHATDYLHSVLDELKADPSISDMEVVDEVNTPLPDDKFPAWANANQNDPMGKRFKVNEVGYLQVKFNHKGTPMTASLGTTVQGVIATKQLPNMNRPISEFATLSVGPTTLITLVANPSPTLSKEVQVMASSIRITPQFLSYWKQLQTKLASIYLGAARAAQQYKDLTWHERSMAQFRDEMKLRDGYSRQFCNYIQDQQDYKDGQGHIVTVPNTYRYALTDNHGNYIVTDEASLDTRGMGYGDFHPMEKARADDY